MLSNKVSEIMTTDLVKATVSATIYSVMETMVAEDVGRIIITDDEVPVGIFTEKDVLKRVMGTAIDAKKASIKDVMTAPVRAVREETHIVDAFARMYRGKYRHLLVRGRRGKIIGIVSMRRILNIAVELGQGISESRTVGDIPAAPITTVDESSTVHATVNLMNQRGLTAVIVTAAGTPDGNLYRARRAEAGRDSGHGSPANAGKTSHDRAADCRAAHDSSGRCAGRNVPPRHSQYAGGRGAKPTPRSNRHAGDSPICTSV